MSAPFTASTLRRAVGVVALLNLGYAGFEFVMAITTNSVSLFADAADFIEDGAINLLVFFALGFAQTAAQRERWGKILAGIVLIPAVAALVQAILKLLHQETPHPAGMLGTALGALVVNSVCAVILARFRSESGALARAAWLAARNDVIINILIIAAAVLTWWMLDVNGSWAFMPDLVLGVLIVLITLGAAKEVWEVAEEEGLAEKALAGEEIGD